MHFWFQAKLWLKCTTPMSSKCYGNGFSFSFQMMKIIANGENKRSENWSYLILVSNFREKSGDFRSFFSSLSFFVSFLYLPNDGCCNLVFKVILLRRKKFPIWIKFTVSLKHLFLLCKYILCQGVNVTLDMLTYEWTRMAHPILSIWYVKIVIKMEISYNFDEDPMYISFEFTIFISLVTKWCKNWEA